MDKRSKILAITLFILFFLSALLAYYRFFVIRDYDVIEEEYIEEEYLENKNISDDDRMYYENGFNEQTQE